MSKLDEFFRSIANAQRRRLLVHMLSHNPEDESKVYTGDIEKSDEELSILLVQMEQTHLPLLEDYGFINWDRKNHEVTKGPQFDEIRPLLEMIVNHRDELPDNWL
ncbi:transcriptional regulator [Halomontanus rarus]|uniref:transcriptional regulator n=1 Tax=Halomontanus rarus TaxID=3034020 RepID=UPI002FF84255